MEVEGGGVLVGGGGGRRKQQQVVSRCCSVPPATSRHLLAPNNLHNSYKYSLQELRNTACKN